MFQNISLLAETAESKKTESTTYVTILDKTTNGALR